MMEVIMEKAYMHIGKKADGTLVCHASLDAMRDIDGVTTVLKKIPLEEFEAAGGLVREIGGKIVIGKTGAELAAEQSQSRVAEIDRELVELNTKQARSSAEIADALAHGQEPPAQAVQYHREREERAAGLRAERAQLLAS
jgi:hypothetical protein